jgi:hypothetical protein
MPKAKPRKKRGANPARHTFIFKSTQGDILAKAAVFPAKKAVTLILTEQHVQRALELKGQGDAFNCGMAVCSRAHRDFFPHDFSYVEWCDSRAYFVTKVKDGLPSECVVYKHYDDIAPLFDDQAGMRRLLKELKTNGPRTVRLHPWVVRPKQTTSPGPRRIRDGSRIATRAAHKGAMKRFTRVNAGLNAALT